MSEFEENEGSSFGLDSDTSSTRNNKRKTSWVWNSFGEERIDGTLYAVCECGKKFKKGKKNHGTTTLKNHLELRCPRRPKKANEFESFNQEVSRADLAYMVILHEYPLSIVDHPGFRKFVSGLRPEFKMVSRNTLKKDIIAIFNTEKQKNFNLLGKVDRIALTTDMWTCKPTKRGFMAITAHFIDEKWNLQSRILQFVYVPSPHSSDVLLNFLIESLFYWNISNKISAITVDNATTNNAMMDGIVDRISRSSFLLRGRFIHMRCCCHILNLIVKEGMDVIANQITKIRDSCIFWSANQSRKEKFEDAVRQLNLPVRALETDVRTRWSSSYLMLRTALFYKDVFIKLKNEKQYICLPNANDWSLAFELCEKLKLFYSITELFSGTTYPTANDYFVKICKIKVSLDDWFESSVGTVKLMASKMLEKYNKYWSECQVIMGIACVLDPRYKMKLVEYNYKIIHGTNAEMEIQKLRKYCDDLFSEYQSSATSGTVAFSSLQLEDPILDDDLSGFDHFLCSTGGNNFQQSELERYLDTPVLPKESRIGFDILAWWKSEGTNYPILQKMARDILAIPVSTIASESSFSKSGRLIGEHRSRLQPSTLEALMCAQSWIWNDRRASEASTSSLQPPSSSRLPSTPRPPTINDVEEDPEP